MLIAARNAMMAGKRLPYDAEVSYLRQTGNSRSYILIDESYSPLNDYDIDVRVPNTNGNGDRVKIFGYLSEKSNFGIYQFPGLAAAWYYKQYRTCNNGFEIAYSYGDRSNLRYKFEFRGVNVKVYNNNELIFDINLGSQRANFSCSQTPLFGWINIDTGAVVPGFWGDNVSLGYVDVYSFRIIRNSDIVRDLIPVREDGVGYMYDKVSKTLFANQGTGAFIIGPDIAGGGV